MVNKIEFDYPPKILIVDDSRLALEIAKNFLEKNNFQVQTLNSGQEIHKKIDSEMPDIILLDVLMPEVDGNDVLRNIRARFSPVELPVIMVTSKNDSKDIIESLNLGANDYILKPVEFEVAIRRIKTHLAISKLSKTMANLKEIDAINAMIATYNHEINNPLSIALGFLNDAEAKYKKEINFTKLSEALWRIASIVKKTQEVLEKGSVEYEKYANNSKMLKLQNK